MKTALRVAVFLAVAISLAVAAKAAPGQRIAKTINCEWTFNYFPAENADSLGCEAPGFDDSAWPAVAVPDFRKADKDCRVTMLEVIASLNPNVERDAIRSGGEKVDGVRQKTIETFTYAVAPGQPVLVPDLKFLDNAARKARKKESN